MPRKQKAPRKVPKRRMAHVERLHNGGEWTASRMRGFIISALRRAGWPVKYSIIRDSFVEYGINPATGRKCKMHRCSACLKLVTQKELKVDHIEPVVPLNHGWEQGENFLGYNFNQLLPRLFVEAEGLQALCEPCHNLKSNQEREARKPKQ